MITIQEYLLSKSKPKLNMIKATDENIRQIVKDELDRLGHDANLNHIDVSQVTNMNNLFSCYSSDLGSKYKDLNPDIAQWDVSNVEEMRYMFCFCESFNCDISQWDVSKVKHMKGMFWFCESFNQDLSQWDTRNIKVKYDNDEVFDHCPIKEEFKPKFNI